VPTRATDAAAAATSSEADGGFDSADLSKAVHAGAKSAAPGAAAAVAAATNAAAAS
ncbi:unnamed protein product, partial [Ectocarpus sp. 8 AP-2014]